MIFAEYGNYNLQLECPISASRWWKDLWVSCFEGTHANWVDSVIRRKVGFGEKNQFLKDPW